MTYMHSYPSESQNHFHFYSHSQISPRDMPYKANLIRATNGNGPPLLNYNRRNATGAAPVTRRRPMLLPRLPRGYIYYGVQQNLHAQASVHGGAITGYEQRLSPETMSTLHVLQRKPRRGRNCHKITSIFFDKSSPGFEWLIDGWLGEKRILSENTHYWLYYDPLGKQYRSKQQVLKLWKEHDSYSSKSEVAKEGKN